MSKAKQLTDILPNGFTKVQLIGNDFIDYIEEGFGVRAEILKKYLTKPNYCYVHGVYAVNNPNAAMEYIEKLRQAGLDIGRGNCEFGFKIPIPEKNKYQTDRKVIIFKRR